MRILLLAFLVPIAFGCSRGPISVRAAKKHAEVVFRGTIVGFRSSTGDETKTDLSETRQPGWTAVFLVARVWKGTVGPTFEMPALPEGGACFGFWPTFLKVGTDILVYANRIDGAGDYYTDICNRTQFASMTKDFAQLGPGHKPRQSKHAP